MKKLIAILLCVLTVLPLCLVGGGLVYSSAAQTKVVYLKDGGAGDGSSPDKAVGKLTDAYNKLGDEGGRIVVCGKFTLTAHMTEPVHTGLVTVTQYHDDINYGADGTFDVGSGKCRYILNGPTTFENIKFTGKSGAYLFFIAQNNKIEMGEGVVCEGFDYARIDNAVTVLGGRQNGAAPAVDRGFDSDITIKSGKFIVVGMNRQMSDAWTGTANIKILGGEITTLYGGSVNAGSTANSNITIDGGKFTGAFNAGNIVSQKLTLKLNGGDFSSCKAIVGGGEDSTVSVAKSVEADVSSLLSGFKTINTSEGVKTQLIPEEVFGEGSFTSSGGTTLPYRIYFPEGYDKNADKTYPVFFYFHGLGSRGSDNKLQLGATHALIPKVLNSGTECIIVAPQCPTSGQWVANSSYPGGTGFDPKKDPESPQLIAAIELMNKIVSEEKADKTRIYLGGASNGAAACWSIISRSPSSVAGALIQAGTGSTGAAEVVAEACLTTPIWTFHGDKDTTLSVEGTRQIAAKLTELGAKNFTYTEMPGYNHNIWVDSANMKGVVEWLVSQKRDGALGVFSLKIEETPDIPPVTDNTTPLDSTPADSETADTKPTETSSTETKPDSTKASETQAATDTSAAPTEESSFPVVAVVIGAVVVVAVAAAVAVIIIKKKKEQE